jgi:sugar phosphate isomerase/epimerase
MARRRWRVCDADWNHRADGLSDEAFLAAADELGLDGVELGIYRAAEQLTSRRLAAFEDPPVAMLLLSLPGDRWPGGALSTRTAEVAAEVATVAAVSRALGLPVIGLSPGADRAGADIVPGLAAAAEAAATSLVRVAVEYKPGTAVASGQEALALAAAVPGTGVLLDTGHAFAAGEDPAMAVRWLGDLLWHVHLGDADEGEPDARLPLGRRHDPAPFLAALDETGYAGAATFDLCGAVSGGLGAVDAVRESLDALAAATTRSPR